MGSDPAKQWNWLSSDATQVRAGIPRDHPGIADELERVPSDLKQGLQKDFLLGDDRNAKTKPWKMDVEGMLKAATSMVHPVGGASVSWW